MTRQPAEREAIAAALRAARGFVFDVDGTLAMGDRRLSGYQALPGARELIGRLEREGIPFLAFTNGTTKTPREYAMALQRIGLPIDDDRMMTPVSVATEFLARRGARRVLVMGVEGVWQPLEEAGFEVVVSPQPAEDADAVLVGWHPEFGLADLDVASRALWNGAAMYAVSVAPYFASSAGRALGISGAIVAALRSVTGKRATVLGKPSQHALRYASRRLGFAPSELVVIGDDPVLEVSMARQGGALAVAVHSGLNDAEVFARLAPEKRPHLSIAGVHELLPLLDT